MLKNRYNTAQRQGCNQVWTAAGEYDFDPLFIAMRPDGTPDIYMNSIIGYACKWCGIDHIKTFFDCWKDDVWQAMLDDLAWLALESDVYSLEYPLRPALQNERRIHAEEFFAQESLLSHQEWMGGNSLVYALHSARWKEVLEKSSTLLSPHELKLFSALSISGLSDCDVLFSQILSVFREFNLFNGTPNSEKAWQRRLQKGLNHLLYRFMPVRLVHTDKLKMSQDITSVAPKNSGLNRRGSLHLLEHRESDMDYIKSSFGPSLLNQAELDDAEKELCTGIHRNCHLWFTSGLPDIERCTGSESLQVAIEAARQQRKNREAYKNDSDLYQNAILRLTHHIRSCLSLCSPLEAEQSRSGAPDIPRIWRAAVVHDPHVFQRSFPGECPDFTIDLLLDASASRLYCQEAISAQGYVLAESMRRCGIPVRILSFCSLRGYTVLRVLKDYSDINGCRKAFRYFAAGWNRDGLGLKAAGYLLSRSPGTRRFLLILTDASPNDSQRIPSGNGNILSIEYSGAAAVKDAAEQVSRLRRDGVSVGAIFMGDDRSAADAVSIFGKQMVCIRGAEQLADAAGSLIRQQLEQPGFLT